MVAIYNRLILLALLGCVTVGCGLNSPVLQRGGNGRLGLLLNYSCGAHRCDPIDPDKPTFVLTHGWNPLPNKIHVTFGQAASQAIRCRYGDACNLLSWDWSAVRISPFHNQPILTGREQGKRMAAALRARGVVPNRTHMIGHSLGSLVAAQAACCLSDLGPMAQITMLDPPKDMQKEIFFHLGAAYHAEVVENYWAPGISGFGKHAGYAGVRNYIVRGTTPVRGIIDLSISNHMHVMQWYYQSIRCPSTPYGFQQSVLLEPYRPLAFYVCCASFSTGVRNTGGDCLTHVGAARAFGRNQSNRPRPPPPRPRMPCFEDDDEDENEKLAQKTSFHGFVSQRGWPPVLRTPQSFEVSLRVGKVHSERLSVPPSCPWYRPT